MLLPLAVLPTTCKSVAAWVTEDPRDPKVLSGLSG